MTFTLTKHHGAGNDFLILLTDDPSVLDDPSWPERARRWCERRTGVGADGLIIGGYGRAATVPGASASTDLSMTLFNADGSPAEISGNGLRCLVQAEAMRRGVEDGSLLVATGGGPRRVEFEPDPAGDPFTMSARADMGHARPGPEPDRDLSTTSSGTSTPSALATDAIAQAVVDVGNPHLVLLVADPTAVDIGAAGPLHEERWNDGMNVHVVAPAEGESDTIDMVIWERGAGVTGACGSGAAAVAHVARSWGLVGERVTLHMPGGDAVVDVGETLVLHGTAVYTAAIELPEVPGHGSNEEPA